MAEKPKSFGILLKVGTGRAESGAMEQTATNSRKERSSFRLPMVAGEPVYLLMRVDGADVDPVVDELGANGARFAAVNDFSRFHVGQDLGPAVLVMPERGMASVRPIVRWMNYPRIGVEFEGIGERDREQIFRFMFRVERRTIPMERTGTLQDRVH